MLLGIPHNIVYELKGWVSKEAEIQVEAILLYDLALKVMLHYFHQCCWVKTATTFHLVSERSEIDCSSQKRDAKSLEKFVEAEILLYLIL